MSDKINKVVQLPAADEENFAKIMNEINAYMNWHKDHQTPPAIGELDQFHKSWFYNNWLVRFRHLRAFSSLGTRGVIAIPNTTFEEWLWWFHEWAEALTDDYNEFKKMVYEALQLIEKHLEAIDKILEDHEERITKLEEEIEQIKQEIKEIKQDISNLQNEVNNIKNDIENLGDQITNLTQQIGDNDKLLQKIINKLIDAGAWDQGAGDFKPGMGIAAGNINLFGGSPDGDSFIRTNGGQSENDITAGI